MLLAVGRQLVDDPRRACSAACRSPAVLGDPARVDEAAQRRVERAVGQRPEDPERGGEPLAQLVAVQRALVEQAEDRELEQRGAAAVGRIGATVHCNAIYRGDTSPSTDIARAFVTVGTVAQDISSRDTSRDIGASDWDGRLSCDSRHTDGRLVRAQSPHDERRVTRRRPAIRQSGWPRRRATAGPAPRPDRASGRLTVPKRPVARRARRGKVSQVGRSASLLSGARCRRLLVIGVVGSSSPTPRPPRQPNELADAAGLDRLLRRRQDRARPHRRRRGQPRVGAAVQGARPRPGRPHRRRGPRLLREQRHLRRRHPPRGQDEPSRARPRSAARRSPSSTSRTTSSRQDRTLSRKAKEILIAVKIDQRAAKDEILENYLNTIYYGRGAYGIQSAAQGLLRQGRQQADRRRGRRAGLGHQRAVALRPRQRREGRRPTSRSATPTCSTAWSARAGSQPPTAPSSPAAEILVYKATSSRRPQRLHHRRGEEGAAPHVGPPTRTSTRAACGSSRRSTRGAGRRDRRRSRSTCRRRPRAGRPHRHPAR